MSFKLKWTMPFILSLLLFSTPLSAESPMEPMGKILGGSLESPVRIEVFSNFGCSACREYYLRTIKGILEEYSSKNKVCIIYHDFPFENHKYDREAARYVEAASRISRDAMLRVFDALYTDQAEWSENGELQKALGKTLSKEELDKIREIATDPGIQSLIDAQYDLAIKNGLNHTPTSFIFSPGKQQKVEGILTYFVLKTFIDKVIQ
jgi:protein-disulfide isomerase